MTASRFYMGATPRNGVLVARFTGYAEPTAATSVPGWLLFLRPERCLGSWLALKLVAAERVAHKANYWLGWHIREQRFNHFKDARALEAERSELWFSVKIALEVLVDDHGIVAGEHVKGLPFEPRDIPFHPGFRASVEWIRSDASNPLLDPLRVQDKGSVREPLPNRGRENDPRKTAQVSHSSSTPLLPPCTPLYIKVGAGEGGGSLGAKSPNADSEDDLL